LACGAPPAAARVNRTARIGPSPQRRLTSR
jgi:hypothetical protein